MGESVSCMTVSPRVQLQVATGGKENDLKVWDGNKLDQPVFQAKNVRLKLMSRSSSCQQLFCTHVHLCCLLVHYICLRENELIKGKFDLS